ncbi:MAG: hypothetical protein WEA58_05415 [Balneolaceae bacterium]
MNKNSDKKKPFWKRPIPITVTVLLLIALVMGLFYLVSYGESKIEERVISELNNQFSPDSEWEIGEIDVRLFPMGVMLQDIELNHTTPFQDQRFEKTTDALRNFSAESIEISGIKLGMLFSEDKYEIGTIHINSPQIDVLYRQGKEIETEGSDRGDQEFELGEFEIRNATINVYKYRADDEPSSEIEGLNLAVMDITYSETAETLDELVSYYAINLESITHKMQDDNYQLEFGNIEFDSSNNDLEISTTKLRPLLSLQELSSKMGERLDHFDVVSGPIKIHDLEPNQWTVNNILKAGFVEIDGLRLYISKDKNFPQGERSQKKLLNVAFHDLDFAVDMDSVSWTNGLVSYEETEEDQERSGRVFFDEIDLQIVDLQNRDTDSPITINAETMFMEESMLNVDFSFSLDDNGRQTIQGELAPIDLEIINPVIEPLAFIRISDGRAERLTFEFEASDFLATGEMIVIYDNLNIEKLDSETLEQDVGSRVVSFVANLAVVKSSNSEDDPRVGEINFERQKDRSTFSYWWKALRSGLKSSAGM